MSHEKVASVTVENDNVIMNGDMVKLRWSPGSILPPELSDDYTIDVIIGEYIPAKGQWNYTKLATDMPDSGYMEIPAPERESRSNNDTGSPAVFEIRVSNTNNEIGRKRGLFSDIVRGVVKFVKAVTDIILLPVKIVLEPLRRIACELWGDTQSRQRAQEILSMLPPCPCTAAEIARLGSDFKKDNIITTTIYHPAADVCYRQRNP